MAMTEDHLPFLHAGEQPNVVVGGLRRKAVDVRERRAVAIERVLALGERRQADECVDLSRRELGDRRGQRREHHLALLRRQVQRRVDEPALAVSAQPGRVRQLAQPRQRLDRPGPEGAIVAAEQPLVDSLGLGEDGLERREVAVHVVEDPQHC